MQLRVLSICLGGFLLASSPFSIDRMSVQALTASSCGPVHLDIGHTPEKPGATSARGEKEYEFNKRFVHELEARLIEEGQAPVEILEPDGQEIALERRARITGALEAGLLISIHHDSVQPQYLRDWIVDGARQQYSDKFAGYSLFVSALSPAFTRSVDLAEALGGELLRAGASPSLHHNEPIAGENRPLLDRKTGLYRYDRLAILRNAQVPAVLIEVGVIVNREEEEKLNEAPYRRTLQNAIASAITRFCDQESSLSR
jgi:N-acetylmuramoyl-L-alanine amidase